MLAVSRSSLVSFPITLAVGPVRPTHDVERATAHRSDCRRRFLNSFTPFTDSTDGIQCMKHATEDTESSRSNVLSTAEVRALCAINESTGDSRAEAYS